MPLQSDLFQRRWRTKTGLMMLARLLILGAVMTTLTGTPSQARAINDERTLTPKDTGDASLIAKIASDSQRSYRMPPACEGQSPAPFVNMDYAMLGYNILRGNPLSPGRDPGFAFPIFRADADADSGVLFSADCQHLSPPGYFVLPDMSCVTSFSTETVYSSSELLNILMGDNYKMATNGWGLPFSASKLTELTAKIDSGETALYLSYAICRTYSIKLKVHDPPPFSLEFLNWVMKLNNTDKDDDYFQFFDTFGTHLIKEAEFGAKHVTQESFMSSILASENTEPSFEMFSIGDRGKLSPGNARIRKISVGVPLPANMEAREWAAQVDRSPLPYQVQTLSMETLFTDRFMGPRSRMKVLKINFSKINARIRANKAAYCKSLQLKGEVGNCADYVTILPFIGVRIQDPANSNSAQALNVESIGQCINACKNRKDCVVNTFMMRERKCYILIKVSNLQASNDSHFHSTIHLSKLAGALTLHNTGIVGQDRFPGTSTEIKTIAQCLQRCMDDDYCMAFTFSCNPDLVQQCKLFSSKIKYLYQETDRITYVIRPKLPPTTVASTPDWLSVGRACNDLDQCPRGFTQCLDNRCHCQLGSYYSDVKDICYRVCSQEHLRDTFMAYARKWVSAAVTDDRKDLLACRDACRARPDCLSFSHAELENAALGKPTTASTIETANRAAIAVDGNTDFELGSCIQPTPAMGETVWWEVDLLETAPVHLVALTSIGTKEGIAACPPGLQERFEQSCYNITQPADVYRTYSMLQDDCSSLGGHLVEPRTEAAKAFLYRKLGEEFYLIGATYDPKKGSYNWASDGSVLDQSTTVGDGVGVDRSLTHCVVKTLNQRWSAVKCNQMNPFYRVCEKRLPVVIETLADIRIDVADAAVGSYRRCHTHEGDFGFGVTKFMPCAPSPILGRYVKISKTSASWSLSFCELEVLVPKEGGQYKHCALSGSIFPLAGYNYDGGALYTRNCA